MNERYYFGVNGQSIGPLDEHAIRGHIEKGDITRQTLVWRKDMDNWRPLAEISELMAAFGDLLATPPPLPTQADSPATPPPLPGSSGPKAAGKQDPTDPKYEVPAGLSGLNAAAYRFVFWLYRPWRNRPSRVREYVRENPDRAVPVAGISIVGLFFLFVFAISPMLEIEEPAPPVSQQMPQPSWSVGTNPYQPMLDAQRYSQSVIEDVYRDSRDSFDRQSETYRRGTYDWYGRD